MKSVIDWLKEELIVNRFNGGEQVQNTTTIACRLAELIAVNNGSTVVTQWGASKKDAKHPYGRFGLTMNEALELINLHGLFSGFILCQDDKLTAKAAKAMIQAEIVKAKKEGFNPTNENLIQIYTEGDLDLMTKIEKEVARTLRG